MASIPIESGRGCGRARGGALDHVGELSLTGQETGPEWSSIQQQGESKGV
jgi:hypothetical protein